MLAKIMEIANTISVIGLLTFTPFTTIMTNTFTLVCLGPWLFLIPFAAI